MKVINALWIVMCLFFLVAGFNMGMVSQQMAMKNSVMDILPLLEGVEINVDINETYMMDRTEEITQDMVNQMVESLNKSSDAVYTEGDKK